jgi:hypothetical protein
MSDDRVYGRRYPPKPRELPESLAKEIAVLHTLPQVMRIIRTANTMLTHPVDRESPEDEALYMHGLLYEAWNTLAILGAGRFESQFPTPTPDQPPP